MKYSYLLSLLTLVSFVLSQETFIEFKDFTRNELRSAVFELTSEQSIQLEAIGPKMGSQEENSYIWIMDFRTREAVWILDDAESKRSDVRKLRRYSDEIKLKEGVYKIFYSTFAANSRSFFSLNLKEFFGLFSGKGYYRKRDLRTFSLYLSGKAKVISNPEDDLKNLGKFQIISKVKMRGDVYERIGLDVKRNTSVFIYSLGEVTRDGNFDFAWIQSIETGEKLWELNRRNSDYAGGGEKNRFFKGNVELEKGNYVLTLVSDDSHHYDDWNTVPPYDPDAWGFSLYTENKDDIEIVNYKKSEERNIILSMIELGDGEYRKEGFTLTKDANVRIYAIGEGYDELADYGWIIDAKTHEKIWEMDDYNTDHAGGATKNRLVNEQVHLKRGSYIVYFVTDDSHSYRDRWNASKPYDGEHWGITLYGVGNDFDMDIVKKYEEEKEANVIVEITRIRDDEYESERFTLTRDTKVRIYAIGEGSSGDMADYGWIKNAETNRKVWRMRFHDTVHAGGARKNRQIDEVITLKKGEYKVYYKTDGSHAFRDWNSNPPYDQEHWGITIYKAK